VCCHHAVSNNCDGPILSAFSTDAAIAAAAAACWLLPQARLLIAPPQQKQAAGEAEPAEEAEEGEEARPKKKKGPRPPERQDQLLLCSHAASGRQSRHCKRYRHKGAGCWHCMVHWIVPDCQMTDCAVVLQTSHACISICAGAQPARLVILVQCAGTCCDGHHW